MTQVLDVLRYYADQYCEGWCKDAPVSADFSDCDGCRARLALQTENDVKRQINKLIYAQGAPLGSDQYFEIRRICAAPAAAFTGEHETGGAA